MANNHANIKLSYLSESQQETLDIYYPVVKKLFLAEPDGNTTPPETADKEFKADIVNFLCCMETIFGETPPKSISSIEKSKEQFIVESTLACSRLSYRNWFWGYSYLTEIMLNRFHAVARQAAVVNIEENASMFSLTDKQITVLKETILSNLDSEIYWINEVNQFNKNKVLSEIKASLLEDLKKLLNEEFTTLVVKSHSKFYDQQIFRQKAMKLLSSALRRFQEQIPYKEDKLTGVTISKELDDQMVKFLGDLCNRNKINRTIPVKLMLQKVQRSAELYTKKFGSQLKEDPLAEPYNIRMLHENFQELYMPIFETSNTRLDDLRSDLLEKFFGETDRIFEEQICEHGKSTIEFLEKSYQDIFKVFDVFVGEETTDKTPMDLIQKIRQIFNGQLEIVVGEIKDSTIANPEVVENLVYWGQPVKSKGRNFVKSKR